MRRAGCRGVSPVQQPRRSGIPLKGAESVLPSRAPAPTASEARTTDEPSKGTRPSGIESSVGEDLAPAESGTWIFPFDEPPRPDEVDTQALSVNATDDTVTYYVAVPQNIAVAVNYTCTSPISQVPVSEIQAQLTTYEQQILAITEKDQGPLTESPTPSTTDSPTPNPTATSPTTTPSQTTEATDSASPASTSSAP